MFGNTSPEQAQGLGRATGVVQGNIEKQFRYFQLA